MAKILTQKEVEAKVASMYNGEYRLVSDYTKMTEPAVLLHLPCNSRVEVGRLKSFTNEGGCKCKICSPLIYGNSTRHITEKEVIDRIHEQVNDEYTYLSGYIATKQKCLFRHNVCGNEFMMTPDMFLGTKQRRCPVCANINRGAYALKDNYLQQILDEATDGSEYEWLEEYKNDNKVKHKILHKKCNESYKVRPNDFQQEYRCPHCSAMKNDSRKSILIWKVLQKSKVKFVKEKTFKECRDTNLLPFDFYLKEPKLIIEFDGSQHFKITKSSFFEKKFRTIQKHDSIKNEFCNSKKVNIIRIPYNLRDEKIIEVMSSIVNNEDIVEIIKKYNLYAKYNGIKYNQKSYYESFNRHYFS